MYGNHFHVLNMLASSYNERNMRYRHLLYLMILVSLFTSRIEGSSEPKDELFGYINPDVKIGYTFGEGFSWGVEVTFGAFYWKPPIPHGSIAIEWERKWDFPLEFIYVSFQGGLTSIGGSIGRTFYKVDNKFRTGKRYSAYVGLPIPIELEQIRLWFISTEFVSYEYTKFPALDKTFYNLCLWGKIPIVLPGYPFID